MSFLYQNPLFLFTEHCQWQTWSNWDQCSKSCNNGTTTRIRKIIKEASNGGLCPGQGTETKSCNEQGCPGMKYFLKGISCKSLAKVKNKHFFYHF